MNYRQAIIFFQEKKEQYRIPESATLGYMTKRIVEIDLSAQEGGPQQVADVLAWVCRYHNESPPRVIELTATMEGRIVRHGTRV